MARGRPKTTPSAKRLAAESIGRLLGPIGSTGTTFYSGYYNVKDDLEYVTELKDERAITTYNRMRRSDGQVQLALLALENPVINANWTLHPPGDPRHDDKPTPEELERTKLINDWFFGEEFQFTETMRQILAMYWAGFSLFEKIYAYNHNDILVVKRLAPRLQNTIREWDITDGKINAVRQVIYAGETARDVWIPGDKIVCFSFRKEGDDFRGISALRPAYKHWFHKDFFYRIDAMRIERWGLGIPAIMEDELVSTSGRTADIIEAVENMRAHEKGFVYVPRGYRVEMLDAGSAKMVDPIPSIQHHDAAILKTIMAQFLELGMTETGARSLGETLKNQYLASLQFVANYIADTLNRDVIKPIMRMNWGEDARAPYLVAYGIQNEDVSILATAFNALGNSGLVTKGPKIEGYIRELLGIPNEDEEFLEEEQERKDKMADALAKSSQEDDSDSAEDDTETEETPPNAEGDDDAEETAIETKQKGGTKLAEALPKTDIGQEAPIVHQEFWRPLRWYEELMSLRAIIGKLDDSREQIVRATRESRERAVQALMPQIMSAYQRNDPKLVSDIDVPDEVYAMFASEIVDAAKDVYDFGQQQVMMEIKRQNREVPLRNAFPNDPNKPLDEPADASMVKDFIEVDAEQTAEKTLDPIVDAARAESQTAMRTGVLDVVQVSEGLLERSDNVARDQAGRIINQYLSLGRDDTAKHLKDQIKYAYYTAIMDNGTCPNCMALDERQERYIIGSPEYERNTPPLHNCHGKTRCRCSWFYVISETAPEA